VPLDFWEGYQALPQEIRNRADQKFSLLKVNQQHPSLQFKKIGVRQGQEIWSARVTLNYRALAIKRTDTCGFGLVTTTPTIF
jgi:hypothetical protein